MLETKMVSLMKHQKDRMDNLMPQSERVQLINVLKSISATHLECSTVIGHPNFIPHTKAWVDDIHNAGLKCTFRQAHWNMEGLYGQPRFVGASRKPEQFWIDEAVKAFNLIKDVIQSGDEEALYPERTEGIFQDSTAFIGTGLPGSYATFFINLHNALKTFGWTVGLSANNASELMSGWMPAALINYAGMSVVDHYRDGDPTLYEKEIRDIKNKYGRPVYVQEGAPHRFTKPTKAQSDAYFAVNKKLVDEGILIGFGSWSGWAGAPESIVDKVDGVYKLNDSGESLKAWWGGSPISEPEPDPEPDPTPEPTPEPGDERIIQITNVSYMVGLTNKGRLYKLSGDEITEVDLPSFE